MVNQRVQKYSTLSESTPYISFGSKVVLDELFRIDTTTKYSFRADKFYLPNGGDMVLYGGQIEGYDIFIPFSGLLPGHWIYTNQMIKVVTSHDFGGTLGVVTTTTDPILWYSSGSRVSG